MFLALQCGFALSAHAQAQGTPANFAQPKAAETTDVKAIISSPEYMELIREGMLKYTRGLWPEARAYFLKAHELAPNARTLRGLALIGYDSHHYVEAIGFGEQALVHPVAPLNEKMAEELKQLLQQAQGLVARVQPVTSPQAAELRVDGQVVAIRGDGNVWVDPGAHDLTVSAPGYIAQTQHLELADGSQTSLDVVLAARSAPARARSAALAPQKASSEGRGAAPWIVVGVAAAVAAVGGVLIAIDQSDGTSNKTPAGAVMLGVGGVGIAAGLTWSLWPQSQPERAPSAQLRIGPTSVQLRGSF